MNVLAGVEIALGRAKTVTGTVQYKTHFATAHAMWTLSLSDG